MSGASAQTQRVQYINANWAGGEEFDLLVVTEDGTRHVLPVSAPAFAALSATMREGVVHLFDAEAKTLIIGNLVGNWIPQDWSKAQTSAG
ncbi:hypothetical protein GCM10011512_07630 [Tersicoccus solisilvae]|uniref:SseB protein N-terminal domain-containing protein n=1 Tax=Tersicoccus solisilvae TaxID=1882339 RepID=A0ABQ1NRR6_9MICC|nr:hypothetical protein [Tersicoccus solisilvae]GGC83337.1 hypothetical protein GCM10011512_07630 [Tersicoccus solisilvae]